MDILNPTAPAVPRKELTPGQAALDEAEKQLQSFRALACGMEKEASDLQKAAKDLAREMNYQREHGLEQVAQGNWTEAEYEQSVKNMAKKQEKPWAVLQAKADAMTKQLEGPQKMLMYAKERVLHARGDGVTAGVFGTLNSDQKEVRRVYDHKMRFDFDEAEALRKSLVAYPDGNLTQVHLFHKRAEPNPKHGNLYLAAHQQQKV